MKNFFKVLLILFMAHSSRLMAQNTMSLSSAEGVPGDIVTIELSVTNSDSFVAFQTEIPLGDNLHYAANSAVLYRGADHQLVASVVEGTLKLYAFSLSGKAFNGSEGKIATFQLRLGSSSGSFPLKHTKAKIVDAASNALPLTTINGSVKVNAAEIEIRTPQLDYGHVPIRSSYNKTLTVKNTGNMPLTIREIRFSDATLSCPSFTEKVVNVGGTASFTVVYSPVVAGAVSYKITVISDASNGSQSAVVLADPYSVNELHIVSTSGICDEVVDVSIKVNNMDAITGFQLFIKMPAALQYQQGSFELSSRKTNHVCAANLRNDTLVMMAYSATNEAFSGDDGIIATFKVKLKGTSGYHYMYPKNVILADANAANVMSGTYSGYVSVKSPKIYVSGSLDMGSSSVTEIKESTFSIKNNGNASLRIDEVLFDGDYLYCSTELPLIIGSYKTANITVCCNSTTDGDFKNTMRIYSNDPVDGLKSVKVTGHRYAPNGLDIDHEPITTLDYIDVILDMNNYSGITAIQADFSYPNEFYTLKGEDICLAERCQGFSLTSVPVNDSTFKLIMFSMNNNIISGNEGPVFRIRLVRKADADNESATVSVKNIILSDVKGVNKNSEGDKIKKIELVMTSLRELRQGWNWYSTNLNISGEDGLNALKEALCDNASIIKSQTEFTLYYEDHDIWDGSLNSFDYKTFYMINILNPMVLEMRGLLTDVSDYSIVIKKGWNWINYSNHEEISMDEIDFGFTPADGDLIKSQTEFAKYYEGYGWDGSMKSLKTGGAYMYYSFDADNKIMSFQKVSKISDKQ